MRGGVCIFLFGKNPGSLFQMFNPVELYNHSVQLIPHAASLPVAATYCYYLSLYWLIERRHSVRNDFFLESLHKYYVDITSYRYTVCIYIYIYQIIYMMYLYLIHFIRYCLSDGIYINIRFIPYSRVQSNVQCRTLLVHARQVYLPCIWKRNLPNIYTYRMYIHTQNIYTQNKGMLYIHIQRKQEC